MLKFFSADNEIVLQHTCLSKFFYSQKLHSVKIYFNITECRYFVDYFVVDSLWLSIVYFRIALKWKRTSKNPGVLISQELKIESVHRKHVKVSKKLLKLLTQKELTSEINGLKNYVKLIRALRCDWELMGQIWYCSKQLILRVKISSIMATIHTIFIPD